MNFVHCALLFMPLVTAFHSSPALSGYRHRFRTESSKWTSFHRRNNSLMSVKNHQGDLPRLPPPDDSKRDGEIPTSEADVRFKLFTFVRLTMISELSCRLQYCISFVNSVVPTIPRTSSTWLNTLPSKNVASPYLNAASVINVFPHDSREPTNVFRAMQFLTALG